MRRRNLCQATLANALAAIALSCNCHTSQRHQLPFRASCTTTSVAQICAHCTELQLGQCAARTELCAETRARAARPLQGFASWRRRRAPKQQLVCAGRPAGRSLVLPRGACTNQFAFKRRQVNTTQLLSQTKANCVVVVVSRPIALTNKKPSPSNQNTANMLLSMLIKLYEQQLELDKQPSTAAPPAGPFSQQQLVAQLNNMQQRSPLASPNTIVGQQQQQQQPDEQALAAVIAAKQLLQLQQFGRNHNQQQQQHLQQQQPLHQIQQAAAQQQQQQPFDLSIKSSSHNVSPNDSNTSSNSTANSYKLATSSNNDLGSPTDLSLYDTSKLQLNTSSSVSPPASNLTGSPSPIYKPRFSACSSPLSNAGRLSPVTPPQLQHHHHHHHHQMAYHHRHPDQYQQAGSMSPTDSYCGELDSGDNKLQQPFKIIRDKDNNFSCQYCSKKYQSMGALKMHVRTHTLPCQCKICGKSFSRPWLLQGHIRTHTGEKPFKCDQCNRAFADRSNLRAHLQTHAKVKKYSCKCCFKTFSRMSLQVKHEEHCQVGSINNIKTSGNDVSGQLYSPAGTPPMAVNMNTADQQQQYNNNNSTTHLRQHQDQQNHLHQQLQQHQNRLLDEDESCSDFDDEPELEMDVDVMENQATNKYQCAQSAQQSA